MFSPKVLYQQFNKMLLCMPPGKFRFVSKDIAKSCLGNIEINTLPFIVVKRIIILVQYLKPVIQKSSNFKIIYRLRVKWYRNISYFTVLTRLSFSWSTSKVVNISLESNFIIYVIRSWVHLKNVVPAGPCRRRLLCDDIFDCPRPLELWTIWPFFTNFNIMSVEGVVPNPGAEYLILFSR